MMHGIFIKAFVWILLAGFLLLPATFVNFQDKKSGTKGVAGSLIGSLQHVPEWVICFSDTAELANKKLFVTQIHSRMCLWWHWYSRDVLVLVQMAGKLYLDMQ
jgi:hypothetical protein